MSRLVSDDAWAAMTIWQESRGESHAGRVAVAEVIRNRMRRKYSSDGTVAGTVLRAMQFSGWRALDPNRIASASLDDADPLVADCLLAWRQACDGSDTVKGAVLYFNPAIVSRPQWATVCDEVAVIGAHHFYKPKGWT